MQKRVVLICPKTKYLNSVLYSMQFIIALKDFFTSLDLLVKNYNNMLMWLVTTFTANFVNYHIIDKLADILLFKAAMMVV